MAFHNGGAGNGNQAPGPIIHHEYHEHRHFHYHHFTTPEFEEADRQDVEQHLKPQLEAANPTGPLVHYHHYFHRVQVPPPPPLNHQAQGGAQQLQEGAIGVAEAAHGGNIQVDQQQAHIQVQEDDDGAEHGNVQEEGNNNEADQEQGNNNQADQEDGAADGNN